MIDRPALHSFASALVSLLLSPSVCALQGSTPEVSAFATEFIKRKKQATANKQGKTAHKREWNLRNIVIAVVIFIIIGVAVAVATSTSR